MCLLGQVSDARLGRSQGRASGLDLAAGCHCGSDLHVVLGICFLGSLHGPRHTLLTMSERHLMLLEVSAELRLSLSLFYSFSIGHGKSLGQATRPWAEAFAPHRLQHHSTMGL